MGFTEAMGATQALSDLSAPLSGPRRAFGRPRFRAPSRYGLRWSWAAPRPWKGRPYQPRATLWELRVRAAGRGSTSRWFLRRWFAMRRNHDDW